MLGEKSGSAAAALAPRRWRGVMRDDEDVTLDAAVDGVDRPALKTEDWTEMLDAGVDRAVRDDDDEV